MKNKKKLLLTLNTLSFLAIPFISAGCKTSKDNSNPLDGKNSSTENPNNNKTPGKDVENKKPDPITPVDPVTPVDPPADPSNPTTDPENPDPKPEDKFDKEKWINKLQDLENSISDLAKEYEKDAVNIILKDINNLKNAINKSHPSEKILEQKCNELQIQINNLNIKSKEKADKINADKIKVETRLKEVDALLATLNSKKSEYEKYENVKSDYESALKEFSKVRKIVEDTPSLNDDGFKYYINQLKNIIKELDGKLQTEEAKSKNDKDKIYQSLIDRLNALEERLKAIRPLDSDNSQFSSLLRNYIDVSKDPSYKNIEKNIADLLSQLQNQSIEPKDFENSFKDISNNIKKLEDKIHDVSTKYSMVDSFNELIKNLVSPARIKLIESDADYIKFLEEKNKISSMITDDNVSINTLEAKINALNKTYIEINKKYDKDEAIRELKAKREELIQKLESVITINKIEEKEESFKDKYSDKYPSIYRRLNSFCFNLKSLFNRLKDKINTDTFILNNENIQPELDHLSSLWNELQQDERQVDEDIKNQGNFNPSTPVENNDIKNKLERLNSLVISSDWAEISIYYQYCVDHRGNKAYKDNYNDLVKTINQTKQKVIENTIDDNNFKNTFKESEANIQTLKQEIQNNYSTIGGWFYTSNGGKNIEKFNRIHQVDPSLVVDLIFRYWNYFDTLLAKINEKINKLDEEVNIKPDSRFYAFQQNKAYSSLARILSFEKLLRIAYFNHDSYGTILKDLKTFIKVVDNHQGVNNFENYKKNINNNYNDLKTVIDNAYKQATTEYENLLKSNDPKIQLYNQKNNFLKTLSLELNENIIWYFIGGQYEKLAESKLFKQDLFNISLEEFENIVTEFSLLVQNCSEQLIQSQIKFDLDHITKNATPENYTDYNIYVHFITKILPDRQPKYSWLNLLAFYKNFCPERYTLLKNTLLLYYVNYFSDNFETIYNNLHKVDYLFNCYTYSTTGSPYAITPDNFVNNHFTIYEDIKNFVENADTINIAKNDLKLKNLLDTLKTKNNNIKEQIVEKFNDITNNGINNNNNCLDEIREFANLISRKTYELEQLRKECNERIESIKKISNITNDDIALKIDGYINELNKIYDNIFDFDFLEYEQLCSKIKNKWSSWTYEEKITYYRKLEQTTEYLRNKSHKTNIDNSFNPNKAITGFSQLINYKDIELDYFINYNKYFEDITKLNSAFYSKLQYESTTKSFGDMYNKLIIAGVNSNLINKINGLNWFDVNKVNSASENLLTYNEAKELQASINTLLDWIQNNPKNYYDWVKETDNIANDFVLINKNQKDNEQYKAIPDFIKEAYINLVNIHRLQSVNDKSKYGSLESHINQWNSEISKLLELLKDTNHYKVQRIKASIETYRKIMQLKADNANTPLYNSKVSLLKAQTTAVLYNTLIDSNLIDDFLSSWTEGANKFLSSLEEFKTLEAKEVKNAASVKPLKDACDKFFEQFDINLFQLINNSKLLDEPALNENSLFKNNEFEKFYYGLVPSNHQRLLLAKIADKIQIIIMKIDRGEITDETTLSTYLKDTFKDVVGLQSTARVLITKKLCYFNTLDVQYKDILPGYQKVKDKITSVLAILNNRVSKLDETTCKTINELTRFIEYSYNYLISNIDKFFNSLNDLIKAEKDKNIKTQLEKIQKTYLPIWNKDSNNLKQLEDKLFKEENLKVFIDKLNQFKDVTQYFALVI
ncbi:hypothetical protein [Mycoplasmopsis adleri]|uniref:hypothetical protein n=1 Tax=Mycoplasmopsis adleri TaxID=51362 RepID=UPI0038732CD2